MKTIITGGCGFIGVNVALRHIKRGDEVIIIDNLSRRGTEFNLKLLKDVTEIKFYRTDIRDFNTINKIFRQNKDIDLIYHLAAQVAVTTSVVNPRDDFEVNVLGTLNILEAMRLNKMESFLIFSSTNKVYGGMENTKIILRNHKYQYKDYPDGIDENFPLDFHSPYGCSKGAADQYVRDYSRIYGLNTVVLRQSCIYGENQFGVEDQGWVAYFTIAAMLGLPITIYGDGRQVRDILYIDDLIDAFFLAYRHRKKIKGEIFNIGGGAKNQLSLLELIKLLEKKLSKKIDLRFADWRPGDQKIFVSNNRKLFDELKWKPTTDIETGLNKLISWTERSREVLEKIHR